MNLETEAGKSQTKSDKYQNSKTCASIVGFDANFLHLYCSGLEMPCYNESYIKVSNPQDPKVIKNLCNKVLADKLFGFLHCSL